MNDAEREKIKRFVKDEQMLGAVFEVIQDSFMKSRPQKDVYYLAAKSLALEFLEEAKRDLERYNMTDTKEEKVTHQVGL